MRQMMDQLIEAERPPKIFIVPFCLDACTGVFLGSERLISAEVFSPGLNAVHKKMNYEVESCERRGECG